MKYKWKKVEINTNESIWSGGVDLERIYESTVNVDGEEIRLRLIPLPDDWCKYDMFSNVKTDGFKCTGVKGVHLETTHVREHYTTIAEAENNLMLVCFKEIEIRRIDENLKLQVIINRQNQTIKTLKETINQSFIAINEVLEKLNKQ